MEKSTYGNGLVRNTTFDALNRPLSSSVGKIDLPVVFSEQTAWTPRSLKAGIARADENGLGKVFRYDGASRVVGVARRPLALLDVTNNSVPSAELIASAKEAEEFAYDAAQNLLRQKERKDESETVTEIPPDESGRNRPASIGGRELEWDANGNLRKKDNLRFAYDWRSRLSKVTRADNGNLVAIYSYDVFNRRVEKEVGGQTYGYAWDGWNQIEDSLNGPNEVRNRRVYGLGLDNALRMDFDLDGSGGPDAQYVPVYDGIGNLVALTNAAGKPVERYEYSAYGKQRIFVDATPPQINQIRKVGSTFLLEMSEEVSLTEIQRQIAEGEIRLSGTGVGGTYGLTATQPVQEGPLARRRVALTTGANIAGDQEVTLTIGAATLVDSFLNTAPAADKVLTLDWETEGVLEDHTNPSVQRIAVRSGKLEIDFDETVDATLASQAILVDGGVVAWTRSASGYQMVADVALTAGSHEVEIGTGAIDLASKGLVAAAEEELSVGAEAYVAVFQVPDAREVLASTANNLFGFHGLPKDLETGFSYVRNRYYDEEVGGFTTTDPSGFIDGPSVYAFSSFSPNNMADSLGLWTETIHGEKIEVGEPPCYEWENRHVSCEKPSAIREEEEYLLDKTWNYLANTRIGKWIDDKVNKVEEAKAEISQKVGAEAERKVREGMGQGKPLTDHERELAREVDLEGPRRQTGGLKPGSYLKTELSNTSGEVARDFAEKGTDAALDSLQGAGAGVVLRRVKGFDYVNDYQKHGKTRQHFNVKFASERDARSFARTKVGHDPIDVGDSKLRSKNGVWQYRAKEDDLADTSHGPHIHLEQLDPDTGLVLENYHLTWDPEKK